MSPTVLNILLFVPFLLVVGITGVTFFISGYKKGPYRALLSLGITVVAAVFSWLLSKLFSWLLAGSMMSILPDSLFAGIGPFDGFLKTIVQGVMQVALSLALFSLILLILLIVMKCVGNRLTFLKKLDEWDHSKKPLQFAGMGIRAVDTLLVSFLLLLPLYGVLATVTAPVSPVLEMRRAEAGAEGETDSTMVCMQTIAKHPLVLAYKVGPAAWMMEGIAGFRVNGADVNLAEIADVVEGLMVRVANVENAEGDAKLPAVQELNRYLRDELVGEKWAYEVICAAKDMAATELEKIEDPQIRAEAERLLALVDMDQEAFEDTAIALIDFITYAIENDYIEYLSGHNGQDVPEEFLSALGALLNDSDQTVALKKMILQQAAERMYADYYGVTPGEYDHDRVTEKAEALVNDHFGNGYVPEEEQIEEAEAFLVMLSGSSDHTELIEAFARHPLFGADAVSEPVNAEP